MRFFCVSSWVQVARYTRYERFSPNEPPIPTVWFAPLGLEPIMPAIHRFPYINDYVNDVFGKEMVHWDYIRLIRRKRAVPVFING